MGDYRIYFLEPDGHIHRPPQIIVCFDDADAEIQSRRLLAENVIEIWQCKRRVAVLTPNENRKEAGGLFGLSAFAQRERSGV